VLGGGVEPGETFLDAAVREVREESGLQVTDMVEICEVVDVQGSGQRLRVFAGSYHGDPSKLVLGEGQRLEFILPHVWPHIDIPPFVRALLERVAAV
jgi:NUDIX domain